MKYRCDTTRFVFYQESIRCAVQLMILDFFDFHAYNYGEDSITPQYAALMSKFLALLDSGIYREHREVTYYASELCITPKYLSEICKKVSGHSANFWINRYTSLDISRQLRDKSLTFVQISDLFHFSSPRLFQPLRSEQPRHEPLRLQRVTRGWIDKIYRLYVTGQKAIYFSSQN